MSATVGSELVQAEKNRISSRNIPLGVISNKLRTFERSKHSLIEYAEQLAEEYIQNSDSNYRKTKGQFFTPKEVSLFMANMFDINKTNFNILDPGAGIGMLSAAFCERILNSGKKISLSIDAYENDSALTPYLRKVLGKSKTALEEKGHIVTYKIIEKDFILDNPNHLNKNTLFETKDSMVFYDYIISNPPYYKLNKKSLQSKIMKEFVSGQPNIYAFFMALSLEMLKPDGQMVFITPRSFCSGLYFKRFRKWFLQHCEVNNIHVFESRSDVFNKKEVLQENIIIKVMPKCNTGVKGQIAITTSKDRLFSDLQKMNIDYQDIFHQKNGDVFIKIPTTKTDVKVQHIISSWKHTLKDFGIKVSTGPVVAFRARKFLSPEFKDKKTTAPLLWMHNIKGMSVVWPLLKNKKETSIRIEERTKPLLVPVRNYVLVKRFSSKEQKRRLCAGVLLESEFNFDKIGIENHLNYIYKLRNALSNDEAYGIAGILNTSIMDIFFRMVNGNTQVNAVDIRNLPFPSLENVIEIGKLVRRIRPSIGLELDRLVIDVLGISHSIIEHLEGGYNNNGQD